MNHFAESAILAELAREQQQRFTAPPPPPVPRPERQRIKDTFSAFCSNQRMRVAAQLRRMHTRLERRKAELSPRYDVEDRGLSQTWHRGLEQRQGDEWDS